MLNVNKIKLDQQSTATEPNQLKKHVSFLQF